MGCCNSKPDANNVQEQAHENQTRNVNTQVPPIVITKAQSVTSRESLLASTSANAISTQSDEPLEKPPARKEEQAYDEPPAFNEEEEETATRKATLDLKPVIIAPQPTTTTTTTTEPTTTTTEPITTTIIPEAESTTHTSPNHTTQPLWTILVRLTSSAQDIAVDIPTSAPFMTVADLKQKITLNSDQQIKLIHLGRILQDNFHLVPSTTEISNKADTIKVSNRGVIQAMIYKV
ncbi:hypothetical protein INT47_007901 [Mucor saturninus]|uniref:DSC E3 ubiquitin ligase complex subunit 3 ubiquitin-like domain-containing protein n=1 Tax=Mucor saturninus TaxID=64648 RepID=A0A8H7QM65_9FUNG|nr:hypothetical protein INT47_007901 [Mucor saturninus]